MNAKKKLKKYLILFLCLCFLFALTGCRGDSSKETAADVSSKPLKLEEEETPPEVPDPVTDTVTFSASGDNLIHKGLYLQAARRAKEGERYDFSASYKNVAKFYKKYDVNWINQETLISDELEPSSCPTFCTPGNCVRSLYDLGVKVYSLSNNHIYDKGSKGISSTLKFWKSMPKDVVTTGLWKGESDYDRIPIQTVNNIKIAYLSYTESTNGIPTPKDAKANIIYTKETKVIRRQIKLAKERADFVIVGTHWGVENDHKVGDKQKKLAQKIADWGADVIIGTHPHVLQDCEWLTSSDSDGHRCFVAYSLGNFISCQSAADNMVGGLLTFRLSKTTNGDGTVSKEVTEPLIHPTVTQFESGYSNCRVYLMKNYTKDLAAKHGLRSVNYKKLLDIAKDTISPEFLAD